MYDIEIAGFFLLGTAMDKGGSRHKNAKENNKKKKKITIRNQ